MTVERFCNYSDSDWLKIQSVVGSARSVDRGWYIGRTFGEKQPLREAMNELARDATSPAKKGPNASQLLRRRSSDLKKLKAARAVLESQFFMPFTEDARIALDEVIAKAEISIRKLENKKTNPSRNRKNRRAFHTYFWLELADLWTALLGPPEKQEQLISFLKAASLPVFPNETKKPEAVSSFVERLLKTNAKPDSF